jgi:hypothetical protein
MSTRALLSPRALGPLALAALASAGCAEVYNPKPSNAVVITGNGWNGYRIYKNGENLGSEWAIRDAVSGDPRAESEADTAVSERVGAAATGIIGAIAAGVGVGLLVDDMNNNNNSVSNTLGAASCALIVGGLALAITGGFLENAAHNHTFNAANMYNDDMSTRSVGVPAIVVQGQPEVVVPGQSGVYLTPGPGYAPRPVETTVLPQ